MSVKEKKFYKPNVYKNGASEDVIDWDDDDVSSVHSIIEKTWVELRLEKRSVALHLSKVS